MRLLFALQYTLGTNGCFDVAIKYGCGKSQHLRELVFLVPPVSPVSPAPFAGVTNKVNREQERWVYILDHYALGKRKSPFRTKRAL